MPPKVQEDFKVVQRIVRTIEAFDSSIETFETYVARYELYATVTRAEESDKVATFLTYAGPKIFGLAQTLMAPEDVASVNYELLIARLKEHFKPKTEQELN